MTRSRLPLLLLLVLSLNVTGFGAAWARGQAPAVGEMVICRGLTVTTVQVDAHGRPTSAPHLCPDVALLLFGAVADAPPEMVAAMLTLPPRFACVADPAQGSETASVRARGPPLSG